MLKVVLQFFFISIIFPTEIKLSSKHFIRFCHVNIDQKKLTKISKINYGIGKLYRIGRSASPCTYVHIQGEAFLLVEKPPLVYVPNMYKGRQGEAGEVREGNSTYPFCSILLCQRSISSYLKADIWKKAVIFKNK